MSTLKELGDYLEARPTLAGFAQGVKLFLASMPDAPDELIVIYQYPGGANEYIQNSFVPYNTRPQIQVVARASEGNYDRADTICSLAWNALVVVRNAVLSGTKYRSIECTERGSVGVDSNDRPLVAFNATIEKEVSLVA